MIKTQVFGRCSVAVLFVAAASLAYAETATDYSTYVQLAVDEPDNLSDSKLHAWFDGANWSDKGAPSPTKDYYVPAGLQMNLHGTNAKPLGTFGGRQLAVAGKLYVSVASGPKNAPVIPDLVCLDGSSIRIASQYGPFGAEGTVLNVAASLANPLTIDYLCQTEGSAALFLNQFVGTGAFVFTRSVANTAANPAIIKLSPNTMDDFHGTMIVSGPNTLVKADGTASLLTSGDVVVRDGGSFYPCFNWQTRANTPEMAMRGLTVGAGGFVVAHVDQRDAEPTAYPYFKVTDSLVFEDGGVFGLEDMTMATMLPGATSVDELGTVLKTWKIFELHGSAAGADLSHFKMSVRGSAASGATFGSDAIKWCLVRSTDGEGVETVRAGYTNLVQLTTFGSYLSGRTSTDPANAAHWSVGRVPTADDAWDILLAAQMGVGDEDVNLPNATVSVSTGTRIMWGATPAGAGQNQTLCAKEFHAGPGAEFIQGITGTATASPTPERHVHANFIRVYRKPFSDAAAYFNAENKTRYLIHAPFTGDGNFQFKNKSADEGVTDYTLTAESPDYAGRFVLGDETGVGNQLHRVSVRIGNDRALGGPVAATENAWKAVEIMASSRLDVTNDVTVAATGRSMFFNGQAEIRVEKDKTLELKNELTFAGTLTKTGKGTVKLSGARPSFIAANGSRTTSVVVGTNRLHVAEGSVGVGSLNASLGLQISFDAGASLQLDLAATGDPKRYGFFNYSVTDPFVLNDEGKIPVSFTGTSSEKEVTLGICTITPAAETNLGITTDSFAFKRFKGWAVKEVTRTVPQSTRIIYSVTLERKDGLLLTIR